MFPPVLVSLFVTGIKQKNYSTDRFHKIRWKGGAWATEKKALDFGGNPDHFTLGLGLGQD